MVETKCRISGEAVSQKWYLIDAIKAQGEIPYVHARISKYTKMVVPTRYNKNESVVS